MHAPACMPPPQALLGIDEACTCLHARSRGFVAGGQRGMIYFYEPPDAADKKSGKNKELFGQVRLGCRV